MSTFLYRLGRFGYTRPWVFIGVWAAVLAIVLGAIGVNGGKISDSTTIKGTPSQQVLDTLSERLPAASGSQGSIVFTVPGGERLDTPERSAALAAAVGAVYQNDLVVNPAEQAAQAAQTPEGQAAAQAAAEAAAEAARAQAAAGGDQPRPLVVAGQPVPGVLVSSQGDVALFQFQMTQQVQDLPEGATAGIVDAAASAAEPAGVTTLPSESLEKREPPIGGTEGLGLLVAALVLVLTLGSLRAAGLPLVTALVGVGIGVGGAFALSHLFEMSSTTPALGLMVGLAVGIDYALFIVNRQRRLILFQGLSAREAAGRAVGTAGSAVFFAGMTVIIALASLTIIGISLLTSMAVVAAATVALAVLIALTLLPSLLGLVGERVVSERARSKRAQMIADEDHGLANRVVTRIVRRPVLVILAAVAVMGVTAIPMASMSLGMPSAASANLDTTARQSYDAITRGFGEGYNAPLLVTAEPGDAVGAGAGTAGGALTPQDLGGIAAAIGSVEGVGTVTPMGVLPSGDLAIFSVIPETGPDSEATVELVHALRDPGSSVAGQFGVELGVTGLTAVNIDVSEKLADVLPVYLAIIVGLSLVILTLVFRSLVIPVVATLGFLLSILATFGLTTAVFHWGWAGGLIGVDTPGPVLSFLPIMVTGILYGLAMDYQVFLVTSMREAHVHGYRQVDAVIHGFDQASRVVVAAAIIMISVFAGFVFSHDAMIKQFGLALAAGIVIDAFLVRMLIIPASMALLGERAWWLPRWLDRLLPDLDVEGDKLVTQLRQGEEAAAAQVARAGS